MVIVCGFRTGLCVVLFWVTSGLLYLMLFVRVGVVICCLVVVLVLVVYFDLGFGYCFVGFYILGLLGMACCAFNLVECSLVWLFICLDW